MWSSMCITFVVVEGFNDVICYVLGTLGMEGVVELDEPAGNKPLGFKSSGEFGGWNAHLFGGCLNGDDAELYHVAFVCNWTSFHSVFAKLLFYKILLPIW